MTGGEPSASAKSPQLLPRSATDFAFSRSTVGDHRVIVADEPAARGNSDQIKLAMRIVLHLSRTGRAGSDEVARPESTQWGMATTLGVTQGAVSKVLHRLDAAGVVRHGRYHVRGQDRRVQAYFVTFRGEELARRYRERFGDGPPP